LGVGCLGAGLGPHPPTPNPQSPIPNPQSPLEKRYLINIIKIIKIIDISLLQKINYLINN
jgi:hypothetical protein